MMASPGSVVVAPMNHLRLLLESLCRANHALLHQKLGLIGALVHRHGRPGAANIFRTPSVVVGGATVGQHYRHSLDHVDRAVRAAVAASAVASKPPTDGARPLFVTYDRRERGGTDESDMELAKERILRIQREVSSLEGSRGGFEDDGVRYAARWVSEAPVVAEFMLSGDSTQEYPLPSTVARVLGFGVHHAIHHMAMVRVAVLNEGWLDADEIDPAFGRAPSTVSYDRTERG